MKTMLGPSSHPVVCRQLLSYWIFLVSMFVHMDMSNILSYQMSFWVSCCDVRYDFYIKTMFGSSLPPVVCRGVCLIYVICVCK